MNKVKKNTLSDFQKFDYQMLISKKYRNRNYYGISVVMSSRMLELYRFVNSVLISLIILLLVYLRAGCIMCWSI